MVKSRSKNTIYGILLNRKGYVKSVGLFRSEKKAKDSWEVLGETGFHEAVFFKYNLRTGKGETLSGTNTLPCNFVFFQELKLKKTVEVK